MRYLVFIVTLIAFIVAVALPVRSENNMPYIASCIIQDSLTIHDDGDGRAIVTYMNSGENCSSPVTKILTSENGIAVEVTISIGEREDSRESIELVPVDSQFMSFPPEEKLFDGETKEFIITGGLS